MVAASTTSKGCYPKYVLQWGPVHRELGSLRAIGVHEIHIGQSHEFLTLVYQIEAGCVRLMWVCRDLAKHGLGRFFALIGAQLASTVEFVCPDMWRPYLGVIATHCPQALNILDRFHMGAKLIKALDEVRAGVPAQGKVPVVPGLGLIGLGGQVPGCLVPTGQAVAHRAAQEVRPHRAHA